MQVVRIDVEFYPHLWFKAPENESADLHDPEHVDRIWYKSLTEDERIVQRLLKPSSASDYLLRIKAEPLLDHPRLFRVALKRAKMRKTREVLHDEYAEDFKEYLALLTEIRRLSSDDVPACYVLTRFYDAMCLQTDGGKVIVISEVLRYFLYFMTLGSPDLIVLGDIPADVQGSAQVIAARIMMLAETLDFDLDPRGRVPAEVDEKLRELVTWQMRFVIGHEYAHHGLGHLSSETSKICAFPSSNGDRHWESYRRSWDNEFEADLHAISDVDDKVARARLVQGAVLFFLNILFHESLAEAFDPEFAAIDTHPPTSERLRRVVEQFGRIIGVDNDWMARGLRYQSARADALVEHFREHPNLMNMYGSVYLGVWKGPELVDRVDY